MYSFLCLIIAIMCVIMPKLLTSSRMDDIEWVLIKLCVLITSLIFIVLGGIILLQDTGNVVISRKITIIGMCCMIIISIVIRKEQENDVWKGIRKRWLYN